MPKLAGPVRGLPFFVLFYLYLWLAVDLRLIYHCGGIIPNFPVFFRGWAFFGEFISRPGGPVEYISAFLSQFFYIGWAGALVVTSQAALISFVTFSIIKTATSRRSFYTALLPAALLLVPYGQYKYHFVTTTALLVAIAFGRLQMKISSKGATIGLAGFILLSVIVYYVSGGAYLLFAAISFIDELLFKRRPLPAILYLLLAIAVPYVEGVLILGVSIIDAFTNLLPFHWRTLSHEVAGGMVTVVCVLYLFLPVLLLAFAIRRLILPASSQQQNPGNLYDKTGLLPLIGKWHRAISARRQLVDSLAVLAVAAVVVFFGFNSRQKTLLAIDFYAHQADWKKVLAAGSGNPTHPYVIHAVNRAMYHTRRMTDDMFSYPQQPNALLLTNDTSLPAYWRIFDTYLDLGLVNLAEHALVQCLEIYGRQPVILRQLALVNMAKGNTGAARVCLGALSRTLFDASWAADYLEKIRIDPNLSTDREIQGLRELIPQTDTDFCFGTAAAPDKSLLALLNTNRKNRMAFEYLMALHLLTGQLDKFVQNIGRLDDFDYPEIPRAYEEAILLYTSIRERPVDLHGRQISAESQQRLEKFNLTLLLCGGNKQAAFRELAGSYGDSYLFYYTYGFSGMKNTVKNAGHEP
jgi:hypothetical protein